MQTVRKAALIVVTAALIGGCAESPVVDNVSLSQSNEVVAFLSSHAIDAYVRKESGGRGRYSVSVAAADYARAATLLSQQQIPRRSDVSFTELLEPRGLMPNSREIEALRLDRARSAELEELLSRIPHAASVRAVVRSSFPLDGSAPSVAVVIERASGRELDRDELMRVITTTVPGISPERIELVINDSAPVGSTLRLDPEANLTPLLFDFKVRRTDYTGLVLTLLGCLAAVGIVCGFSGYRIGRARPNARSPHPEESPPTPAILPDDRDADGKQLLD